MRKICRISVRQAGRGMSLVEMMISLGLLGLIFSFSGFMLIMLSRNAYNLNRQVRGQVACSNAAERSTTLLRSAAYFALWPSDAIPGGGGVVPSQVTRLRFGMPGAGSSVTTHVLCYNPRKQRIEYYNNENNVTFPTTDAQGRAIPSGLPTMKYANISDMSFNFESEYRVTLNMWYEYSGYALREPYSGHKQFGRFVTDVIARRHFMDQGVQNYALGDIATSSPATL